MQVCSKYSGSSVRDIAREVDIGAYPAAAGEEQGGATEQKPDEFRSLQVEVYRWPLVFPPRNGKERKRWSVNWTKLQLWSMTRFRLLFYVDLDVIFLRNTDAVFAQFAESVAEAGHEGTK